MWPFILSTDSLAAGFYLFACADKVSRVLIKITQNCKFLSFKLNWKVDCVIFEGF